MPSPEAGTFTSEEDRSGGCDEDDSLFNEDVEPDSGSKLDFLGG
jgi:hypothetical protein